MTYSSDRREQYVNQGQQDDFFDQDLAIAGHELEQLEPQVDTSISEYQNQGQQDDFFDQDLASSDRG